MEQFFILFRENGAGQWDYTGQDESLEGFIYEFAPIVYELLREELPQSLFRSFSVPYLF